MNTNIDKLINDSPPIELDSNPTFNLFGYTVDQYSLYTHIFSVLTITISTYLLNKYYRVFSESSFAKIAYFFFLGVVIFNIIFSSTKTGDVTFEQAKLQATKDQLLFVLGIIAVIVLFFHNIQHYVVRDKQTVFKLLAITFIIALVSIVDISTVQKPSYIRIVRKTKESLYLLILYMTCVAFAYGFF